MRSITLLRSVPPSVTYLIVCFLVGTRAPCSACTLRFRVAGISFRNKAY